MAKTSTASDGHDERTIMRIGRAEFSALVVDARWLDFDALVVLVSLAEQGAMLFIPNEPSEPGRMRHERYRELLKKLFSLPNVYTGAEVLSAQILGWKLSPLLTSLDEKPLPLYRIRRSANTLLCFFAHPAARGLTYPLQYGYAQTLPNTVRHIRVKIAPRSGPLQSLDLTLDFDSNQSILVDIDSTTADLGSRLLDISYNPSS